MKGESHITNTLRSIVTCAAFSAPPRIFFLDIIFMAYCCPVVLLRTRTTRPNEPLPSVDIKSKSSWLMLLYTCDTLFL
jgi:hypothetical protein